MRFVSVLLFILSLSVSASIQEKMGVFSGRVSKVNPKAGLVRIRINFTNMKYLNKKDKVEFWDERGSSIRCKGFVLGKSNDHMLLRVPEFNYCLKNLAVIEGAYLLFYSQDLVNNLKMGREVISILLKKRLALNGRLKRKEKDLESYIEKINAVNLRYKVLRDKLEAEWRDEIGALEEDKVTTLRNFKDLERRVLEVDNKLEKYKIEDKNLKLDQWALDPRLYYEK
ncbi:MAG: hypothetical protein GY909_13840 [Oligoflexia bacterium]|nr:hypothetical protein [Oligoflexia bacterium]